VTDFKKKLKLKDFTIGFAGRFVEEKGILTLIKAIASLNKNDITLLLIGDGPFRQDIISLSIKSGVDIRIINAVDISVMPYYYNCMDVFILPSISTKYWKEQFGRVLIEAMACEVPVIGSSSGEIPYIISDARLIFEKGNVYDLAEKIKLIMENSVIRKKLKSAGKQRVEKYFTWDKIAKQIYDFFIEILC
jgi:glycosyltransferase involved in cell wall biosynthesis